MSCVSNPGSWQAQRELSRLPAVWLMLSAVISKALVQCLAAMGGAHGKPGAELWGSSRGDIFEGVLSLQR